MVGCSTLLTRLGDFRVKASPFCRSRWLSSLLLLTLWISGAGYAPAADSLQFQGAWIRALPPGMGMTAGFGIFRNESSESIEIAAFSSPEFAEVSLHSTEIVDGLSRMVEVPKLQIEAGESVELAPGGFHLMLMKPVVPIPEGASVTLVVQTADGREFDFEVPVVRR